MGKFPSATQAALCTARAVFVNFLKKNFLPSNKIKYIFDWRSRALILHLAHWDLFIFLAVEIVVFRKIASVLKIHVVFFYVGKLLVSLRYMFFLCLCKCLLFGLPAKDCLCRCRWDRTWIQTRVLPLKSVVVEVVHQNLAQIEDAHTGVDRPFKKYFSSVHLHPCEVFSKYLMPCIQMVCHKFSDLVCLILLALASHQHGEEGFTWCYRTQSCSSACTSSFQNPTLLVSWTRCSFVGMVLSKVFPWISTRCALSSTGVIPREL